MCVDFYNRGLSQCIFELLWWAGRSLMSHTARPSFELLSTYAVWQAIFRKFTQLNQNKNANSVVFCSYVCVCVCITVFGNETENAQIELWQQKKQSCCSTHQLHLPEPALCKFNTSLSLACSVCQLVCVCVCVCERACVCVHKIRYQKLFTNNLIATKRARHAFEGPWHMHIHAHTHAHAHTRTQS